MKPLSNGEFMECDEHCGFELNYQNTLFDDHGPTWSADYCLRPDVLAWLEIHAGPRLEDATWYGSDNGWMLEESNATGILVTYLWFRSRLVAAHFKLVWL